MLYKKSETLWKIPHFATCSGNHLTSPDITLASDRRRLSGAEPGDGQGAFPEGNYPVMIPSPERLFQAYSLLILRFKGHNFSMFFTAMMTYLMEYVVKHGPLDLRHFDGPCRRLYENMMDPNAATENKWESCPGHS